jgi:thymidylate synthase ThyX
MKVTALALCPPPGAKNNPAVTPELLASCLARYSRSNKGIDAILGTIDWNNPDASVDLIFKFVDYGHASITGMTGGIAIVVDNCSMYLAYKIFELAQLCDGQESSTRYIKLDPTNLADPDDIGIPESLTSEWKAYMDQAFSIYHELYAQLDTLAQNDPSVIKLPPDANEKVIKRLRKNYALDRSRYFIPFATRTNAAYIMTARVWADVVKQLDALPHPEARTCAGLIREELTKFVPRMTKHCHADQASTTQASLQFRYAIDQMKQMGIPTDNCPDQAYCALYNDTPDFLGLTQTLNESFAGKTNRYSVTGTTARRSMVRVAWNNMAIAELRDLNRHRSGFRFSPLTPVGFYCPPGITHKAINDLLAKKKAIIGKLIATEKQAPSYIYCLLLGTQVPFEHSTHLDKLIYEIELRTGMGAHFRYAEHLSAVYKELIRIEPNLENVIQVGTAEPE